MQQSGDLMLSAVATDRPSPTDHETELFVKKDLTSESTIGHARTEPVPQPEQPARSAPIARQVRMTVTAYCPCSKCCGENAQGITASGQSVRANHSRFVAADTRILPFHTRLSIPGYDNGKLVPVLDRGGAIKGNRLDVFFPTHQQARNWGVRNLAVTVYED